MQQQLMRRPRVMSGATGGATHMNVVQYRTAGCSTEGRSLFDRFFIDLAVHNDHHDTRNPEGHAGTNYRVRTVRHECANLRLQKSERFQLHEMYRKLL